MQARYFCKNTGYYTGTKNIAKRYSAPLLRRIFATYSLTKACASPRSVFCVIGNSSNFLLHKKSTGIRCFWKMSHAGLEPATPWLKVKCSTAWASSPPYNFLCIEYTKKKCPEPESNQWHTDFQSVALPTELSGHVTSLLYQIYSELQ